MPAKESQSLYAIAYHMDTIRDSWVPQRFHR